MVERLSFRIAGITIAVLSCSPGLTLEVEGARKKFLADTLRADVEIRAHWGTPDPQPSGTILFDSGSVWQLYRQKGSFIFRFTSPAFGPYPYKEASFNDDFTSGEIFLNPDALSPGEPVDPLGYPLDELLMVHCLPQGRGAELHGCGIVDPRGEGHLFLGHSGAGKSTMANLWKAQPNITSLSDDRIILRPDGEKLFMHGTPWHGDAGAASPGCAPVKRIYFLRKGTENELIPLGKTDALARILACSFPPFHSREALDFMLGLFEKLVETVPCCELKFPPREDVVHFIKGLENDC